MSEVAIIRLPSQFDYSYHRQFVESYTAILDDEKMQEMVLDFSQVEYLDSSALGMMVMLQKKSLGKHKKVKVKGARGSTQEILKMANMQKMFEFI